MKKWALLSIIGLVALASSADTAAAQPSGAVCQANNGTAIIKGGLNGSAPGDYEFAFSNDCGGTAKQGCAVGTLASATCAENLHSGNFVYCPTGSCQLDCSPAPGVQACTSNNVDQATIVGTADCVPGTFNGACVGNLCLGSTTGDVLYALAFDQATSMAALATCPPPPVGTGGSLTTAGFSGVLIY